MDVRHACLTVVATAALLASVGGAAVARDEPDRSEPQPQHVLFIGNSHTGRHGGLDWLIENFVAAEGTPRDFDAAALYKGGVTLAYHWQNGAPARIRSGEFDTVVLQGWLSGAETHDAQPFLEHARLLDGIIRESGAKTVFFMAWPRTFDDWPDLDDVIEAHRTISAELGAPVAPAALAFELAQAERPDLALIDADQIHATWQGAYLAAATIYATLFERSPEGLAYDFGVEPDDAAFLQHIAWQAVTDWHAMTSGGRSLAVAD